jgi:adenine-specific DNA-methyltransferase
MKLSYENKHSEDEILSRNLSVEFSGEWNESDNKLIQGDNLYVLKTLLDKYNLKSKVDLIYIDPPFATQKNFTVGEERTSTISNSLNDKLAYSDNLIGADFLEFLRIRLIYLRELMAETASIYLHIDYKIGHYVKIIMDEVFGVRNFRNDITRIKCNPKNFSRRAYGNIKDLILFYTKSDKYVWNEPVDDYTAEDVARLFKKTDKDGRRYTTIPLHAPGETVSGATNQPWRGIKPPKGRHWRSEPKVLEQLEKENLIEWSANGVPRRKIYVDEREGKKKQDIWEYKDAQYPSYPTEKNLEMIKSIISASSNENDLILDCFCGSGTTLQAANQLGRRWVGIDQSSEAIRISEKRLNEMEQDLFSVNAKYQVLKTNQTNYA